MSGRTRIVFIVLPVLLLIAGIIYFFARGQSSPTPPLSQSSVPQSQTQDQSGQPVETNVQARIPWEFNGEAWVANGLVPACPDPLRFEPPADFSLVTAVLYPGQTRSGDYKGHGGFAFQKSSNTDIRVMAPFDAYLFKASRYIEQGEVQYFFVFLNPCGIMYRLDHLAELAPKFQEIISKLPEAKVDDSRTTPIDPPILVQTGEVVGTAVGFRATQNVTFDLGVYDLRKRNDQIGVGEHDKEYAPYGVCIFDLFAESQKLRNLPAHDQASGKSSDYCK